METTIIWTTARRASAATAIAGLALLGATSAASAQTYPSAGQATFSDATPEAGQTIAISGSAVAGTTVSITLAQPDGTIITLGTATADTSGSFNLSITLPASLTNGNYVLAAVNGATVLSSSAFAVSGATTQGGVNPTPVTGVDTTATPAAAAGNGAAAAAQTTLPVTGNESGVLAWAGVGFIVVGGAALVVSKSRSAGAPTTI